VFAAACAAAAALLRCCQMLQRARVLWAAWISCKARRSMRYVHRWYGWAFPEVAVAAAPASLHHQARGRGRSVHASSNVGRKVCCALPVA
jgi:hypothetical protein